MTCPFPLSIAGIQYAERFRRLLHVLSPDDRRLAYVESAAAKVLPKNWCKCDFPDCPGYTIGSSKAKWLALQIKRNAPTSSGAALLGISPVPQLGTSSDSMSKLLVTSGSSTSADEMLTSGRFSAMQSPVLSRCTAIARIEPAITRICPGSPRSGTIDGSLECIIPGSPRPSTFRHCWNHNDRFKN